MRECYISLDRTIVEALSKRTLSRTRNFETSYHIFSLRRGFMASYRHPGTSAKKDALFPFPLVLSLTATSYFVLLLYATLHRPIKSGNLGKIRLTRRLSILFLAETAKRRIRFENVYNGFARVISIINP